MSAVDHRGRFPSVLMTSVGRKYAVCAVNIVSSFNIDLQRVELIGNKWAVP